MTKSDYQLQANTEPVFVPGIAGSIFCIRSTHPDAKKSQNSPVVLLVPPFAEEMNCSRRFFTKLRQTLMLRDVSEVWLPDLYGTGDSAGDFSDARWHIWTSDLRHTINQLRAENDVRPLIIFGVRAGCLLVDDVASDLDVPLDNIVFVSPETSGYDVIQQLLRLRVASRRFFGGKSETTAQLWDRFEAGGSVEVGGYIISPHLACDLRSKRMNMLQDTAATVGHWIELDEQSGSIHRSGSSELAGAYCNSVPEQSVVSESISVSAKRKNNWRYYRRVAKPFWQLHEHEPEDALISDIIRRVLPADQ